MTQYVEQHLAAIWDMTARLSDEIWWQTRGSIAQAMPRPTSHFSSPLPHVVNPPHFDSAWAQLARRR